MKTPIIPEWCKGLPGSTRITSNEILEFFGYKNNPLSVAQYISKGYLPRPIYSKQGSVGAKNRRNKYWLLGDIRKLRVDALSSYDIVNNTKN